jgi:hypothetical protein
MSSNEDMMNLEMQKMTIGAINAYCRVLEVHLKAVAEGANPLKKGTLSDAVQMAGEEVKKEVEFLRFLRSAAAVGESGKASRGD